MTDADEVLLRRIAATPYEAEYDVGVFGGKDRLINISHDGISPHTVTRLALRGWIAISERTERFAQSPRRVLVGKITAHGRHAAGLVPPPRVRKHRPEAVTEEA